MQGQFWRYNPVQNNYVQSDVEPLSVFPTIVRPKEKLVYCRKCHQWEYIIHFKNNLLQTQCGNIYNGPFALENSIINYGYELIKIKNSYRINIKFQNVQLKDRRLFEESFFLDLDKRMLFRENKPVYTTIDVQKNLCPEVTEQIIKEIGAIYKENYGFVPTVASKLKGFFLLIGYTVCPFNINFYQISQHWGLNPYDKDFISLSSGNSSSAEREMFDSLGIKPSKSIRKLYQEKPYSVVTYAVLLNLGFSDVNLLINCAESVLLYDFFKIMMINFCDGEINYVIKNVLTVFVTDLLAITNNQKAVLNSIERTVLFLKQHRSNYSIVVDGMNMYIRARDLLTDREKKDVMHEGFNLYTHDFLMRRLGAANMNITNIYIKANDRLRNIYFKIEQNFLDLEYKCGDNYITRKNKNGTIETVPVDDEDRYCFYVAKCTEELRTVGSEMSNCVGWGYGESVLSRKCTIIYAKYKKKYKICIELSPNFSIRQSLGPHNHPLEGEDFFAFEEWCKAKNISCKKAFSIRAAP